MPGKIRGLFRWCLKVTEGYAGVELVDMTTSWKNGLAFCAIINRFRPDLIDFYSLSPENVYENNDLAFSVMQKEYDIPRLLDPKDMVEMESPDRYSVATYVSAFYECFNDKPMCDPPPVPENWNSEKNTRQKKLSDQSKQRQREPSTLVNVSVQSNKGYDISEGEERNSSFSHTKESVDLDKTVNTPINSSVTKSNATLDDDCDIDDLYSESINILGDEEEDTDLERKQEYTYKDLCQTSIEDIKSSKKGVVLQAMVMAGVTAVAATTISDDNVKDGEESVTEKTTLNNNSASLEPLENLKESLKCALDTFSESRDKSGETTGSDTDFNPNDTDFRTDDSFADSGCDLTSVLTCTTELEGADLDNTGSSVNLQSNLEKENEPSYYLKKENSSFEAKENDQLPTHSIISNENDTKHISLDTEMPACNPMIAKETVDVLNYELNNGEYQITDVNVIDDSATSISFDKPLYGHESDTQISVPCSELSNLKENVTVEKESNPNICDNSLMCDNSICNEVIQHVDAAEEVDIAKNNDPVFIKTEAKVAQNSVEDGHTENSYKVVTIDKPVSSEKLVNMDREQIQYDQLGSKMLKDAFDDLTKEEDSCDISGIRSEELPPFEELNKETDNSAINMPEYEIDFDKRQNNTFAQPFDPEKEQSFAESMATEILNNVLETVKLNQEDVDAEKDNSASMQETEIDILHMHHRAFKDSSRIEISEIQFENRETRGSFGNADCNENGNDIDSDNHDAEEVKHIITPERKNSSGDSSGAESPPPELPSVGPPSLIKTALTENSDIQGYQFNISDSITISPLEVTVSNISVDDSCGIIESTGLETEVKLSTDVNLENTFEQPVEPANTEQKSEENVNKVESEQPYVVYDQLCLKAVEFADAQNDSFQAGGNDLYFENENDSLDIHDEKQNICTQNIHVDEEPCDTESKLDETRIMKLDAHLPVTLIPNHVEKETNNDGTNTEIPCCETLSYDAKVTDTNESLNDKYLQKTESKVETSDLKKESANGSPQGSETGSSFKDDIGSLNVQHVLVDEKPSRNEQSIVEDEQLKDIEVNPDESKVMEHEVCSPSPVKLMPNKVGQENKSQQKHSDDDETCAEIQSIESLSADDNITVKDGSVNDKIPQETESKIQISDVKKEIVQDKQQENGISFKADEGSFNVQHGKPSLNEEYTQEDEGDSDIEPNLPESRAMELEVCSPIILIPNQVGIQNESLQNHSYFDETNDKTPSYMSADVYIAETDGSISDELAQETETKIGLSHVEKEIVQDNQQENGISNKDDEGSFNVQHEKPNLNEENNQEDDQYMNVEPNLSESRAIELQVCSPIVLIPNQIGKENKSLQNHSYFDETNYDTPSSECVPAEAGMTETDGSFNDKITRSKMETPALEKEIVYHNPLHGENVLLFKDDEASSDKQIISVDEKPSMYEQSIVKDEHKQSSEPSFSESNVIGLTQPAIIPKTEAVETDIENNLCDKDQAGTEIPDSGTFSTEANIANTEEIIDLPRPCKTVVPFGEEIKGTDVVLNDTKATADSIETEVPGDLFISTEGVLEKDKTVANSVEAVLGDIKNEPNVKAVPVKIGEVKLDWSTKVSDPNGNIAKEVSLEFTAPISSVGDPTEVPQPNIIEKSYAEIDKDLLRKAAIMSKKMAEKVTSKILVDQSLGEECIETKHDTQGKDFETPITPPPTPVPSQDSAKERRQAMFQFLQNSTRPTKKKFDEENEINLDEKSVDFATKMKLWNRRSFTNADQPRKVSTETAPKKRISLTSPFLDNENKSADDKDKHLERLTRILPDKPAFGSVAEYIKKITENKSPINKEESLHNIFAGYDSDTASEKSDHQKEYVANKVWKDTNMDQGEKPKSNLNEYNMEVEKPFSKDVNPSTIFSARPVVRMRSKNQNVKLPIRPLSLEVKYEEEVKQTEASKPPIHPARLSRRKSERVNIEIQPIDKKPEDRDKSLSYNNEKGEYKQQDLMKRKNSPRRTLSLSSPTRSDSRSSSQERDRNVWINSNEKPPSPKLKRTDSFEIKVRPVTSQKYPQEKFEAKKEKELDSQNSCSFSQYPLTKSKHLPKVNVSVKPVSAKEPHEQFQKDEIKPSVKGGRRSLLSLVSSIKESKQETGKNEIAEKVDQVSDNETNKDEKDNRPNSSNITLKDRSQAIDQDLLAKKPCSKFYSIIKNVVQNDKEKEFENVKENLEEVTDKSIKNKDGDVTVEAFYPCVNNEILAELPTEGKATYRTEEILPKSFVNIEPQFKTKLEPKDCQQKSYQREKEEVVMKCNSIFGSGKSLMTDVDLEMCILMENKEPDESCELVNQDVQEKRAFQPSLPKDAVVNQTSDENSDTSNSSDKSLDNKQKGHLPLNSTADIISNESKDRLEKFIKETSAEKEVPDLTTFQDAEITPYHVPFKPSTDQTQKEKKSGTTNTALLPISVEKDQTGTKADTEVCDQVAHKIPNEEFFTSHQLPALNSQKQDFEEPDPSMKLEIQEPATNQKHTDCQIDKIDNKTPNASEQHILFKVSLGVHSSEEKVPFANKCQPMIKHLKGTDDNPVQGSNLGVGAKNNSNTVSKKKTKKKRKKERCSDSSSESSDFDTDKSEDEDSFTGNGKHFETCAHSRPPVVSSQKSNESSGGKHTSDSKESHSTSEGAAPKEESEIYDKFSSPIGIVLGKSVKDKDEKPLPFQPRKDDLYFDSDEKHQGPFKNLVFGMDNTLTIKDKIHEKDFPDDRNLQKVKEIYVHIDPELESVEKNDAEISAKADIETDMEKVDDTMSLLLKHDLDQKVIENGITYEQSENSAEAEEKGTLNTSDSKSDEDTVFSPASISIMGQQDSNNKAQNAEKYLDAKISRNNMLSEIEEKVQKQDRNKVELFKPDLLEHLPAHQTITEEVSIKKNSDEESILEEEKDISLAATTEIERISNEVKLRPRSVPTEDPESDSSSESEKRADFNLGSKEEKPDIKIWCISPENASEILNSVSSHEPTSQNFEDVKVKEYKEVLIMSIRLDVEGADKKIKENDKNIKEVDEKDTFYSKDARGIKMSTSSESEADIDQGIYPKEDLKDQPRANFESSQNEDKSTPSMDMETRETSTEAASCKPMAKDYSSDAGGDLKQESTSSSDEIHKIKGKVKKKKLARKLSSESRNLGSEVSPCVSADDLKTKFEVSEISHKKPGHSNELTQDLYKSESIFDSSNYEVGVKKTTVDDEEERQLNSNKSLKENGYHADSESSDAEHYDSDEKSEKPTTQFEKLPATKPIITLQERADEIILCETTKNALSNHPDTTFVLESTIPENLSFDSVESSDTENVNKQEVKSSALNTLGSLKEIPGHISERDKSVILPTQDAMHEKSQSNRLPNSPLHTKVGETQDMVSQMVILEDNNKNHLAIIDQVPVIKQDRLLDVRKESQTSTSSSSSGDSEGKDNIVISDIEEVFQRKGNDDGGNENLEEEKDHKTYGKNVQNDLLLTVEQEPAKETYEAELEPKSLKYFEQESKCTEVHDHDKIINDDNYQQDNIRYDRRSSCSSHCSKDSNVSYNKLDEVKVDDQEDDLLKIVIEDSQSFRAPLLETVIDSNIEDCEKDGDNNQLERTASSEDLYSIDKKTENDDLYLLPECNVIGIEYDDICLKEKELPFNILDIEYKPDPIDIQVFVIPDGPINVPVTENVDSKDVILFADEKVKGEMDYNPAIIVPTEQLGNVLERDHIFYDEFNQDDYLSPRQLNEIVLEPILDDAKQTYVEQIECTDKEDSLLQSIIQGQKTVPVRRRKSESSSTSSSDGSKGETENYCDVGIIDDHIYQTLEDDTKQDIDIQLEYFEDGEIYEDINESELKDYDKFKTNSTKLTDSIDINECDKTVQNDPISSDRDDKDKTIDEVSEKSVDWKEEALDVLCSKKNEKLDKASDTPGESVRKVESCNSSSSFDSEEEGKVNSKSDSGTTQDINVCSEKSVEKDDSEKSVEMVIESQIIQDGITLQEASPQQGHGHEEELNFMIGREKDPSKSEVARLIQQSLELDRKREEQRRLEQERLQEQVQPRDEVLERDHHRHLSDSQNHIEREDENVDLDESSIEDEVEAEEKEASSEQFSGQFSEDCQAGEATPISMPSGLDTDNSVSSPEEGASKPVVEVFDLQESSSEDISPDMEAQALFVKLKEAQCKIAVLEAEVAKLKARLIVLENTEAQKKQLEKKNEEMATRLRETEKSLTNARKEINHYQDLLEGSQGQYIKLEKKMTGDFTALEKKYHKAKKLIKEYQQREKDFLAERESLIQQQTEKDQQYNALVKSLKDKIFLLEGELREAQKAAGLPVSDPSHTSQKMEPIVTPVSIQPVKSASPTHDSGSPLMSPLADKDSMSSESETSSADVISPEGEIRAEKVNLFESMPVTRPLDTSVSKAKAQVANNSRRPPTKQRSKSQDSDEMIDIAASTNKDESGLETWIKHDSDNTVKKSDVRKRKAQQQGSDTQTPPATALETEPLAPSVPVSETEDPVGTEEKLPPPPPPPSNPQTSLPESDPIDATRERGDSESGDSSSTVSQSSYDPSKPNFRSKDSEIPSSVENTDTHDTESESSSISAKKSKGFNLPKLPFKFSAGERDKGGVMLISSRTLNTGEDSTGSEGGITLISKRKLDTGIDFDGASLISTISDTSSGYMVGEQESTSYSFSGTPANEDHPSQASPHVQNQFHSCPIAEWNVEHVRNWLIGIEMDRYIPLFTEKSVTGVQLVNLDTNKMKAIGIASSKDRDILKKKVKELKLVLEKERKQLEKERKLLEKEQKAKEKEQKKLSKKK